MARKRDQTGQPGQADEPTVPVTSPDERPGASPAPSATGVPGDAEPVGIEPAGAEPADADRAEVVARPADAETAGDEPTAAVSPGRATEAAPDRPDPADAPGRDDRPEPAPADAPGRSPKRAVAGAMVGLLVGLLGFALVVQVRSNTTDPTLASARQADLLQILADLESRGQRLQGDIADLEQLKRDLASSAQGTQAALEEAKKRADQLGILAGTLPAEGPGLTFTIQANTEPIRAIDIVDVVQELRNAGAEAMQISGANGASVRIIVSTYVTDANGSLNVAGQTLTGPYVITAIGDPSTMDKALRIPGGPVALVTSHGGNVIVGEPGTVRVTALHASASLDYAEPVS